MRNVFLQVVLSIILCSIVAVLILGSVNIYNSKKVLAEEGEQKLAALAESYANEFNLLLQSCEFLVNDTSAVAGTLFTVADYTNNREFFLTQKEQMDRIMKQSTSAAHSITGHYFTFNPNASRGQDEIWYIKSKEGEVVFLDSILISEKWISADMAQVDPNHYYYAAVKHGALWMEPEYDKGLQGDIISYCQAVYDHNDQLIGVAGADIVIEDILSNVEAINTEINGYSALADEEGTILAGDMKDSVAQNADYIVVSRQLKNHWQLILAQPVEVATAAIHGIQTLLILLGALIVAGTIGYAVYFSRKTVQPIMREVAQKDVLLINQARSARLGEMVGSVAHQWKQPLNSMSMGLSNMKDDFDRGELSYEEFHEYIGRLKSIISNLTDTIDEFKNFLKPGREKELFSANEEIYRGLDLASERLRIHSIYPEVNEEQEVLLYGFKNEFSQCILNIIDNAGDAIEAAAPAARRLQINISKQGDSAVIEIFNNGTPIDGETMSHLFELYFSTKEESGGTGIGLYLTKQIVEEHFGGKITAENMAGGVCFRITAPAAEQKGEK